LYGDVINTAHKSFTISLGWGPGIGLIPIIH